MQPVTQPTKGQSDIIAVVLIVLLAIGLLAVAYTFGFPFIQKNQDEAIEGRAKAFFATENQNSLPSKLRAVANSGGRDQASLDVSGVTRIFPASHAGPENNTVEFSFQSTVTSYSANSGWISLSGAACPPESGIIGQDEPVVVCVRADSTSGGFFNVTFRMHARELEDAEQRNGFRINLLQHPASPQTLPGSRVSVRMEFDGRTQETVGGKTLITTNVKILLV